MSNVQCIKCRLPIFHGTSHRCPSDAELQIYRDDLLRPKKPADLTAVCACTHCDTAIEADDVLCLMCLMLYHSPELDNMEAELRRELEERKEPIHD